MARDVNESTDGLSSEERDLRDDELIEAEEGTVPPEIAPEAPAAELAVAAQPAAERKVVKPIAGTEMPAVNQAPRAARSIEDRQGELAAQHDAEIDEEQQEHDEAVAELRQEVKELHEYVRRHRLNPEEAHDRAEALVERFCSSGQEESKYLKHALPRWGRAETFKEKVRLLVEPAVHYDRRGRLQYWTESQFDLRYHDLFGDRIERTFVKRRQGIAATVESELEHEGNEEESSGSARRAA